MDATALAQLKAQIELGRGALVEATQYLDAREEALSRREHALRLAEEQCRLVQSDALNEMARAEQVMLDACDKLKMANSLRDEYARRLVGVPA